MTVPNQRNRARFTPHGAITALKISSSLALMVTLAACGGGGGGNDPKPETPTPGEPPVSSAGTAFQVSGQIIAGDDRSGAAGATGAIASQATMGARNLRAAPIEDATIRVWLYNGSTRDPANRLNDEPVTGTTDENGRFTLIVPEAFGNADRILAEVVREGYIQTSRIFRDLQPGTQVTLDLALAAEQVAVQAVDNVVFNASGQAVLQFGVVRRGDGSRAVVAGGALAAASDDDVEVQLEIPAARVGEGTSAVTAAMAYFDPSVAADAEAFPGDFVGTGNFGAELDGVTLDPDAIGSGSASGAQEVPEEYRLISTAFTQLRLSDQDGNNLAVDFGNNDPAIASEGNPSVLLRVPPGTYNTITQDHDEDMAGIQVPIYLYTGGSWKYAGPATLETDRDGTLYDGGVDPVAFDGTLYARLEINDGNSWVSWLNIDWPIVVGDVTDYCAAADIRFGQGDATTPFSGTVNISLPDGGRQWTHVSNGQLRFTTLAADNLSLDGWEFTLWNPRALRTETLAITPIQGTDCAASTITLENPYTCRLEGQVLRGDTPVANRSVTAQGGRFWQSTRSGQDGGFDFDVPCGVDMNVRTGNVQADFNVNGTLTNPELTDDGITVEVALEVPNQAPTLSMSAPATGIVGQSLGLQVTAWDADGDTITLTCVSNNCGDFTSQTAEGGYLSRTIRFAPDAAGGLDVVLEATDSQGASSGELSRTIQIDPVGNRTPRITRVSRTVDGQTADLRCSGTSFNLSCVDNGVREGRDVTYTAYAHDPDGDTLSFDWTQGEQPMAVSVQSDAFTIIDAASGRITVTANDGQATATANINLTVVENQPPEILSASVTPNTVPATETAPERNAQAIHLRARAIDDFTPDDALDYFWDVMLDDVVAWQGEGAETTIPTGELAPGRYTVRLTAVDGDEAETTRDLSLRVTADRADVEVIIQ
ncbi:hypothetical protein [Ectothiorhodospira shaposhnikovii]|uniref:hypothetical protein n=1 Tax=Ectothiorhodospira shaposhnikovii TaxID=1054 RepID=UPI001EE7C3F8|nr:hypothetical protein [Ectothiorhodospira shaposhnikovii]MCG5512311.1 hypothetical protein [Ectothiorhodospira shaposhnikovii]